MRAALFVYFSTQLCHVYRMPWPFLRRPVEPAQSLPRPASSLAPAAAGLIGVGGGEFRIPVLVRLLEFPLTLAGRINFVVGSFTVVLGAIHRSGQTRNGPATIGCWLPS